jgi:HEAT repeat protein
VSIAGDASQAARELLRQLAIGLSAYRLFPGELDKPGFVGAVERIREAAGRALTHGTVHAEIRAGKLILSDGTELVDDHAARLAEACYARGAEHIHVLHVPGAEEMGAVYDVLSMAPEDVAARGGVGMVAAVRGVSAIQIGEIEPEASEDVAQPLEELSAEELALWKQVKDPEELARNLLSRADEGAGEDEDGSASPVDAARAVYEQFEAVAAVLPPHLTGLPQFARSLTLAARHMPRPVQRQLTALLIGRAGIDPLAARSLGDLTDPELADLLVDLSEDGPDPVDLAHIVVDVCSRHRGLVDLTRSLVDVKRGDMSQHPVVAAVASEEDVTAREAVVDLATSRLVEIEGDDVEAIRAELTDAGGTDLSLAVFADYARNEPDRERLGQVLEVWADHVRTGLRDGDPALAADLIEAADTAFVDLDDERVRLLDAHRSRVADFGLVYDLVHRYPGETVSPEIAAVLARFGGPTVDVALDVLAEEENRAARFVLVRLLSVIAVGHIDLVAARMSDQRWYVVRNAVTILGRIGTGDALLAVLRRAASHPHSAVRSEVVAALRSAGSTDSLAMLRALADDLDDDVRKAAVVALGRLDPEVAVKGLTDVVRSGKRRDVRELALDELGRLPTSEIGTVLSDLAARGGPGPRLPRRLRRQAERMAEKRGVLP